MLIVYIGVYVLIGLIFVSNLGDLLIIDGDDDENACLPMFLAIVFWPLILVYLVIVLYWYILCFTRCLLGFLKLSMGGK